MKPLLAVCALALVIGGLRLRSILRAPDPVPPPREDPFVDIVPVNYTDGTYGYEMWTMTWIQPKMEPGTYAGIQFGPYMLERVMKMPEEYEPQ